MASTNIHEYLSVCPPMPAGPYHQPKKPHPQPKSPKRGARPRTTATGCNVGIPRRCERGSAPQPSTQPRRSRAALALLPPRSHALLHRGPPRAPAHVRSLLCYCLAHVRSLLSPKAPTSTRSHALLALLGRHRVELEGAGVVGDGAVKVPQRVERAPPVEEEVGICRV